MNIVQGGSFSVPLSCSPPGILLGKVVDNQFKSPLVGDMWNSLLLDSSPRALSSQLSLLWSLADCRLLLMEQNFHSVSSQC